MPDKPAGFQWLKDRYNLSHYTLMHSFYIGNNAPVEFEGKFQMAQGDRFLREIAFICSVMSVPGWALKILPKHLHAYPSGNKYMHREETEQLECIPAELYNKYQAGKKEVIQTNC